MKPFADESKRMFGGLCFMRRGNMMIGTFKGGLLVRVGKECHVAALAMPGAKTFEMNGRVSEGYITLSEGAVATDTVLQKWIAMAMTFNSTLPAKAKKPAAKKVKKK